MFSIFGKKQNIMKKYSEYKYYTDTNENANMRWIALKAEGWKKLTHEMLDDRIAEDFGLHRIKERFWASDYDDGRRKVISIFLVNDMYATIQWGWNFENIPKISGSKCVWARTDKSIYLHTFRLPQEFVNGKEYPDGYEKAVFGRSFYCKPEQFDNAIVEDLETAYEFVRKYIKVYFDKTKTYDGLLAELEDICGNMYYCFLHPDNYLVYLAVENQIGNREKAKKHFEMMDYFKDAELKAEYGRKIGIEI